MSRKQDLHLLTYDQAAELLNVTKQALYAMVKRDQIPYMRMTKRTVRFDKNELLGWLNRHRIEKEMNGGKYE